MPPALRIIVMVALLVPYDLAARYGASVFQPFVLCFEGEKFPVPR